MKLIQIVFVGMLVHRAVTNPVLDNAYDDNQDPNLWQSSGKFEGDMILTQEQRNNLRKDDKFRNGVIDTRLRWPNKMIPYVISNDFNTTEKKLINNALKEDYSRTCIRVVPRKNEVDYVYVTGQNTGCWSNVGRLGGRQALNLQRNGCLRKGTIVHEFMHAAGFYHQQCATERDDYVVIQWQNIEPGAEHNFDKYGTHIVSNFNTNYDYGSLMHSDAYAFSKNKEKTIVTIDKTAIIGKATKLSPIDITKLNRMYGCG